MTPLRSTSEFALSKLGDNHRGSDAVIKYNILDMALPMGVFDMFDFTNKTHKAQVTVHFFVLGKSRIIVSRKSVCQRC
jgi:hypothetical protein